VTERDKKDILFAIENKFHFIAPSFIRNASNVEEIRQLLAENKAEDIKIISKIENQEGIENMEEIIKSSDGVMVAR
jgi:pyruvate kinase